MGKDASPAPSAQPAPAGATDAPPEQMSLARARRKRAARIARRAAMEAARAGGVGAGSLEAAARGDEDDSAAPAPEGILLGDASARVGGGLKTAGRFAARRAKADAIRLAARRRGAGASRGAAEGVAAGSEPPPRSPAGRSRSGRAQRRTAKSWALKALGMGVDTVAAGAPSAMGRFLSGADPIPRAVRAARRPGRGIAAAIAAGGLVPALVVAALVLAIPAAAGGAAALLGGQNKTSTGSLNGNAQVIAANLLAKNLDPMHVAAIMGNMCQESGYDPASRNPSSGAFGICQWLGGRKGGLVALCRARGVPETDLATQVDFAYMELMMDGAAGWNSVADRDAFLAITGDDRLEDAVAFFARRFERCGEDEMNLPKRMAEADRVLAALNEGPGGVEYEASDETARKIADCTAKVPSPGAGLCAMWVSQVYELAGCGYPGGNACDMYDKWCTTSDRSQLKVGMMVAVPHHPLTSAGKTYGHVGIYIGDGRVRHNTGVIQTDSLDSWISIYGADAQVRWGYPPGVQHGKERP